MIRAKKGEKFHKKFFINQEIKILMADGFSLCRVLEKDFVFFKKIEII